VAEVVCFQVVHVAVHLSTYFMWRNISLLLCRISHVFITCVDTAENVFKVRDQMSRSRAD